MIKEKSMGQESIAIFIDEILLMRTQLLIDALQKEAIQRQLFVQIFLTQHHADLEKQYLQYCKQHKITGIIVASLSKTLEKELSALDIPVVYSYDERLQYEMGVVLGEYLRKQKYLNLQILQENEIISSPRMKGIRQAYDYAHQPFHMQSFVVDGQRDIQSMIQHISSQRPDVIITEHEELAMAVLKHTKESQIEIPQHVSLVSFEGQRLASLLSPSLTVVDIDYIQYAKYLFANLNKEIYNDNIDFVLQVNESSR